MNQATLRLQPTTPAPLLEDDPWTRRVLHQERAELDLETARRIRASLLEPSRAGESPFLSWASFSRPSRVVGGDFHDVSPRSSGGVDVVVGDVAAKGLPAALMGAACLNQVLRATAASGVSGHPAEILTRASHALSDETAARATFPRMVFVRIEADPLTLTLADAGHASVAIRSADGSVYESRGVKAPFGSRGDAFPESAIALSPGDLVLVSTDGLSDLARKRLRIFNVAAWLSESCAETPLQVVQALAHELERWFPSGDAPDDDVTFVAVGIKPNRVEFR